MKKQLGRKNAVAAIGLRLLTGSFTSAQKSHRGRASIPRSAAQTAGRERFQRRSSAVLNAATDEIIARLASYRAR
jgi:hypothetical protein